MYFLPLLPFRVSYDYLQWNVLTMDTISTRALYRTGSSTVQVTVSNSRIYYSFYTSSGIVLFYICLVYLYQYFYGPGTWTLSVTKTLENFRKLKPFLNFSVISLDQAQSKSGAKSSSTAVCTLQQVQGDNRKHKEWCTLILNLQSFPYNNRLCPLIESHDIH